jgi:ADP-ribose pyrophosphatase YjhB (NUDIX family)
MNFCSSCGAPVAKKRPGGDTRDRWVCESCEAIHYQNPKIVVGCLPEHEGKVLLCKRAIEPRTGFWTAPAGFMEIGESIAEGAARETLEEACAEVEIGHLFASVDVVYAGQVHLFFTARLLGDFSAGEESLEVALFSVADIPWDNIAFSSNRFALEKYIEDAGQNNGVHRRVFRHRRNADPVT